MRTPSHFNPGAKSKPHRSPMDDAEKERLMHEMLARGEKQSRILRTLNISGQTMQRWLDRKRRGTPISAGNVAGPCYARGYVGWGRGRGGSY